MRKAKKRIGANQKKKIAEKQGQRKGLRTTFPSWGKYLLSGLLAVTGISAAGIWSMPKIKAMVSNSELFILQSIEVDETRIINEDDIIKVSGLNEGMHILSIKPKNIRNELEKLEWVKKAQVYRRFPNKIKIIVIERKPHVMVSIGSVYYMDKEGKLLNLIPGTFSELPLIAGINDTVTDPKNGLMMSKAGVQKISAFLKKVELQDQSLMDEIALIDFSDSTSIRFTLTLQKTVIKMENKGVTKKIEQLCKLLSILRTESEKLPRNINLCQSNFAYVN